MKKLFKKSVCFVVLLAVLLSAAATFAITPSAGISCASSVSVGNTITVTVTLRGDNVLGAEFNLKFDSSRLMYVSSSDGNKTSSNVIKNVVIANSASSSISCTIKFKAISSGTASLQISDCSLYNVDLATIGSPTAAKSITINAASGGSSGSGSSGGSSGSGSSGTAVQENLGLKTAVETTIGDRTLMLWTLLDDVKLPAGFAVAETPYLQNEIDMAVNSAKTVTLAYTTDKDGKNGAFYIYRDGQFYSYVVLSPTQKSYTVLAGAAPEPLEDFSRETTLTIEGLGTLTAWKSDLAVYSHLYALYLADDQGRADFYIYNATDGTIQRYIEYYEPPVTADDPTQETPSQSYSDKVLAVVDRILSDDTVFPIVAWLLVLLIAGAILLGIKTRRNDSLEQQLQSTAEALAEAAPVIVADERPVPLLEQPLVDFSEKAIDDTDEGSEQPIASESADGKEQAENGDAAAEQAPVQTETAATDMSDAATPAEPNGEPATPASNVPTAETPDTAEAGEGAENAEANSDIADTVQGERDGESAPLSEVISPAPPETDAETATCAAAEKKVGLLARLFGKKRSAPPQNLEAAEEQAIVEQNDSATETQPETDADTVSAEVAPETEKAQQGEQDFENLITRLLDKKKTSKEAAAASAATAAAGQASDAATDGVSDTHTESPSEQFNQEAANEAQEAPAASAAAPETETSGEQAASAAPAGVPAGTPPPSAGDGKAVPAGAQQPIAAEDKTIEGGEPEAARAQAEAEQPLPEAQEYTAPFSAQQTAQALFHNADDVQPAPLTEPDTLAPQPAPAEQPEPADSRSAEEINISRLVDRYRSQNKKKKDDKS